MREVPQLQWQPQCQQRCFVVCTYFRDVQRHQSTLLATPLSFC